MKEFWNERYNNDEYAFGIQPNVFLKEKLTQFKAGNILIPGAGEGRDAVYAAKKRWEVDAFDYSLQGKEKALKLAKENDVSISFNVMDAADFNCSNKYYDAIALIYFHLPPLLRKELHKKLITCLKPGGVLILEAFNPKQLENASGGPKDITMLYTQDIIKEDFKDLTIEFLQTLRTELDEGKYHCGMADVIRFVGKKII